MVAGDWSGVVGVLAGDGLRHRGCAAELHFNFPLVGGRGQRGGVVGEEEITFRAPGGPAEWLPDGPVAIVMPKTRATAAAVAVAAIKARRRLRLGRCRPRGRRRRAASPQEDAGRFCVGRRWDSVRPNIGRAVVEFGCLHVAEEFVGQPGASSLRTPLAALRRASRSWSVVMIAGPWTVKGRGREWRADEGARDEVAPWRLRE